jgi:hypothetical protein
VVNFSIEIGLSSCPYFNKYSLGVKSWRDSCGMTFRSAITIRRLSSGHHRGEQPDFNPGRGGQFRPDLGGQFGPE